MLLANVVGAGAAHPTPPPTEHSSPSRSVASSEFSPTRGATLLIPSEQEAMNYYFGLPSRPVLVARTSATPWKMPNGPGAFLTPKELRVVDDPALADLWHTQVARQVHAVLDSKGVKWGSTNIVRIGYVGDANPPVILWIGICPNALSAIKGSEVALACKAVLVEHGIEEVDVEIRESLVTRSIGPKLLEPGLTSDPDVEFRMCLTPTLGLSISNAATPWAEGTGGFFIASGGADSKVLLVTARHVLFKHDKDDNNTYERKNVSAPRKDVVLLGNEAYNRLTRSIMVEVGNKGGDIETFKQRLELIKGKVDTRFDRERTQVKRGITEAEEAIEELMKLHEEARRWKQLEDRVIGHVVYAPPITFGVGPDEYTEDFALVEIDTSRFDASNVKINCIDLGTKISVANLKSMMHPNTASPHTFDYPPDRLLPLRGTISVEEMRKPAMLDEKGDHCIIVLQRGHTSGLTIGRASSIDSYLRFYDDLVPRTTREWTIIPYDSKSGAFSDKGDSGSVVVDGRGRIGGLLTAGDGFSQIRKLDLTYATPIDFLLKRIKAWEGATGAHLNPQLY